MRLQFGLLWIEDNYSPAEEEAIRNAAQVAGFELDIVNSADGSDIENLASQQQRYHLFDLVLLDLKLANGAMGDELAGRVRAFFRSVPILFYSGSENEDALRGRMAASKIEGIFCANRANFTTRAGEVIADLAHSLNRLSGMRGLSMEVVAEADGLCRELVASICSEGHEEFAVQELRKSVGEQAKKVLDGFSKVEGIGNCLADRSVDSMKLFGVFRDLLKKKIASLPAGELKDELRSLAVATKDYRQTVLEVRNVLGHSLERRTDSGWEILNEKGEVYMTVNDFPGHRNNFLSNLRAIRNIRKLLVAQ